MSLETIWRPYRTYKYLSVPIIEPELLQHTELERNELFEGKKYTCTFLVRKME